MTSVVLVAISDIKYKVRTGVVNGQDTRLSWWLIHVHLSNASHYTEYTTYITNYTFTAVTAQSFAAAASYFKCLFTGLFFCSHSRLGQFPKSKLLWNCCRRTLHKLNAVPVNQPTVSKHQHVNSMACCTDNEFHKQ